MKILCTICARGGSTGIKNKNIRMLCGKPLIAHSVIQARETNLFNLVVVSSDSYKIRCLAKKWGADHMINRPKALATAVAPKLPTIQHAVLESEKIYGEQFDLIVDLDVTAPLRTVEDIRISCKMLIEHPTAGNLVTACPARKSPYFNMLELDSSGFTHLVKKPNQIIYRRQDTPICYDMNASIYIWKREALFKSQSAITEKTILYVMPEERSIDIDTIHDWKLVKLLIKERRDFIT